MKRDLKDRLKVVLIAVALAGLLVGLGLSIGGFDKLAPAVWAAGVFPVLAALLIEIVQNLRRGEVGLDIVAALSMSAALFFGETLAAAVVAVMYAGGTFLESFAEGRARREMRELLSRVPRSATRHRNGALEDVPLDEIAPGDCLLIRQGDVAPVDGLVESDSAILDQSALTGESMPVRLARGQEVMSGSTNAGEAFDLRASRPAAESTYAGIVRLVEEAQRSKAPMSRLADRYSLLFLAVTAALATTAWWFTGDPIRAVAVLVVATPCPLILAVPVALVAGLSRAAHFGVLIKGAKPLEAMARIRTLILGAAFDHPASRAGAVLVALAVDGRLAAHMVMADVLREGTAEFLSGLRRLGVGRILLATGDRHTVAKAITEGLDLDAVRSELTPDQKVLLVLTERKNGPVMMVGDGVNDAPALAAADIGVAMGARGAAASAEAADVVLLVDRLSRLLPGLEIARGSRRIALESVIAGIGLSVAGMIAAALGYLTPVQGALLQELIDVAVILNALRALRIAPTAA